MSIITGKEYPLKKIFSERFEFNIPSYQRPYAWTTEESGTLVEDLIDFYKSSDDNYFLGSIVLIKDSDEPFSEIIDGQQRLTTLTMILSVLASMFEADIKNLCLDYIRERGNVIEGIKPQPRLHLRNKDQDFFNYYVQGLNIDELGDLDLKTLPNEAQKNIKANVKIIVDKLKEEFGEDEKALFDFLQFIVQRCYLVVVTTNNKTTAFRVFSVMNNRGLDLMPTDIIKSDIIGKIDPEEQDKYTDIWEELEIETGRSRFNDVFSNIRMIFIKEKAQKSLLEELQEIIIPQFQPDEFIDQIITPYTDVFNIIINSAFESAKNADQINDSLFWLNRIDNTDWIPVAMEFLIHNRNDSDYVDWFLKKLERLASYLHLTAKDVNKRVKRYSLILNEMEDNPDHNYNHPLETVELSPEEQDEFLKVLDGEIYRMTPVRRNFLVLRLNSFVGDESYKEFNPKVLTIEHVLPQTVTNDSDWALNWPDKDIRDYWLNRIANLVPLTRRKNSSAQNFSFDKKKEKYFQNRNGVTSYPLTTQVINETEWTPEIVEKRQNEILEIFKQNWELEYLENSENSVANEYYLNQRGSKAKGLYTEDKFIVQKGSKISDYIVDSFYQYYPKAFNLRNQLIEDGIINNGIFTQDYSFNSPSLAGAVIIGGTINGYTQWKTKFGKPLSESL